MGPGAIVGATSVAINAVQTRSSRLKSLLHVLVIAAASAFLIYLAYPRLHASLLYLPVDTAINRFYDTQEIPSGQLEGLQARAQDAIDIHPHHRYWDGLSLLYFLQGSDTSGPLFERRQAHENTIEAAEASLALAPGQPRTWLRIAQARSWLRYPPEQVIDALQMAIYTGRVEPSLLMTRLRLGLAYLPRMDAEATAMLRDQLLLAWRLQPRDVTRAVKQRSLRWASIEQLLAESDRAVLAEIEESAGGAVR